MIMKFLEDLTQIKLLSEWQELKDYLDVMESYIGKTQDEFEKKLKKLASAEQHDYLVENPDEYLSINQEFPRILHNSFFISTCSLLEYCLGTMCREFKDAEIRISYGDYTDNKKKNTQDRLLAKLEKLGVPDSTKFCKEISEYIIVRNSIVHDNGLLKADATELISYAEKKDIDSSLTDEKLLVLTKQFCAKAVQTMGNFVEILYDKLLQRGK